MSTVLLISLDGVRPDGLQRARTPHFDALRRAGSYCPTAQTVMPSATLPCHTSMVRGVTPDRHGITTNTFTPMVRPVPSVLETARQAGLKTASFYNWEPLRDLAAPGTLHLSYFKHSLDGREGDLDIARAAAGYLREEAPDLCFVYFGNPDVAGHDAGWMSDPYLEAIATADRALGMVLEAVNREETFILLVSDHGGHERTHGTEDPRDMTIPWLAAGPGVPAGGTLEGVRIIDSAPTLARALGIPASPEWEGVVRGLAG